MPPESLESAEIIDNDIATTKLTHPRRLAIKCWNELLEDCKTLSCFTGRIESRAEKIAKNEVDGLFDKTGEEGGRCFKGDIFEVFGEYVLKAYGRMWGIYNYVPFFTIAGEDQDVGIDGTGITKDGRVVCVQIKYGNFMEELDNERRRLRTFHWSSMRKGVGTTSKDQMFILTTAKTVHWATINDYFHHRLKFISQLESLGEPIPGTNPNQIYSLKTVCHNNPMFWKTFLNMLKENDQ
jgi:hypothetical protein